MGKPSKPLPVKLIAGFIFKKESYLKKAKFTLQKNFGDIDFTSPLIEFSKTKYYEKELGINLKRQFISFEKLILPEKLSAIKIAANKIENLLSKENLRNINIDPGYLELAKLVLATTKDYAHRIYLSKGIYAEVTLIYQGNTFRPLECTYPDYRAQEYIDIFNRIRQIYKNQI